MRTLTGLALLIAATPALAQEMPPADPPAGDDKAAEGDEKASEGDEKAAEGDKTDEETTEAAAEAPEVDDGTEKPDVPAPEVDAVPAEADATGPDLEARVLQLEELVQAQAELLDAQSADLVQTKLALVPPDEMTFDVEGYYRARAYTFNRLNASQFEDDGDGDPNTLGDYVGDNRFLTHRMKIRPIFNYKDLAKFAFEMDMFGDPIQGRAESVWGDNAQRIPNPLFAADPSNTSVEGIPSGGPRMTRAWMEFSIPVGLLRVGRQPSNWGMGLLANSGDGFDDKFGENNFGATYDRALFATKPIAIFEAITGKGNGDIPLFVGIGVDRLVEDPMHQYYGYQCDNEDPDDDVDNGGNCERTEDHSWVDETRTEDDRRLDWATDPDDDVMETVYLMIYRGEDVNLLGKKGDLTAGAYAVNRVQKESGSNLLITDAYVMLDRKPFSFEFEGVRISGKTAALALPGAINFDPDASPLEKEIAIYGYATRLGWESGVTKLEFEHGYSSGDDNVADAKFTGRAISPDHNVGLLLYEQVLARVSANAWQEAARPLWTNGGVFNSRYVFPTADFELIENWNVVVGGVMAWPDKADGAIICKKDVEFGCAGQTATSSMLGWEVDAALKMSWHQHLRLSLETGYAHATDRMPLGAAGLNPKGNFFTVQTRMAYEF